jgi:hypothetical protein
MQRGAFAVGSLVSTRGREWIVVSNGGYLVQLKPITGLDSETTQFYLPLEGKNVRAAEFEPPNSSASSSQCLQSNSSMKSVPKSQAISFLLRMFGHRLRLKVDANLHRLWSYTRAS